MNGTHKLLFGFDLIIAIHVQFAVTATYILITKHLYFTYCSQYEESRYKLLQHHKQSLHFASNRFKFQLWIAVDTHPRLYPTMTDTCSYMWNFQ